MMGRESSVLFRSSGFGLALAAILAWGVAKQGVEGRLQVERERLHFGGASLTREMRDQIGQGAALALLSGFRGIVADFLWIMAHGHWSNREWHRMRAALELACTLQPRSISFWETSAWHFAWNVSHDALYQSDEPRQAKRIRNSREWIAVGRKFLERGVENNPDQYRLWYALGWLLDQRLKDDLGAVKYYRVAARFPDAPEYIHRLIGYRLERAGQLREAYEHWCGLWREHHEKESGNPHFLWDRVRVHIERLEKDLKISPSDSFFGKDK